MMNDIVSPTIIIDMKSQRIRVCKSTFAVLGYPDHVQVIVNRNRTVLGIRSCQKDDSKAAKVPCSRSKDRDYREIYGSGFYSLFCEICSEWQKDKLYILNGTKMEGKDLVCFKLRDAEEYNEEVLRDNGNDITAVQD